MESGGQKVAEVQENYKRCDLHTTDKEQGHPILGITTFDSGSDKFCLDSSSRGEVGAAWLLHEKQI